MRSLLVCSLFLTLATQAGSQDAKPLPAKDPKGIAGKLGEIVAVEADGFTVVCADGRFKISRVQPADGKKVEAGEWAKSANLAVKTRLT